MRIVLRHDNSGESEAAVARGHNPVSAEDRERLVPKLVVTPFTRHLAHPGKH